MKIKGYASTEALDRDNEIIKSSAFKDSLSDYFNVGGVILFNHDRDKVVGKCLSAVVDEKGLFVEAEIFTEDTEILKAIREGALRAFSVGFIADDVVYSEKGERVYQSGDLLEISVVSVPANTQATFEIIDNKKFTDVVEQKNEKQFVIKEAVKNEDVFKGANMNENIELKNIENVEIKEVKKEIEKEAVEKAVNTLATSTQFGTTSRAFIFDGVADGKTFYIPNTQIQMQTSTVQIPVLGEATVGTGESGISSDSGIGTNTITLNAQQYTARYPLSYLLEMSAGGDSFQTVLETNLKKSIARKFDSVAWTTLKGTPQNFDFDTKTAKDLLEAIVVYGGEYVAEPSNCAMLVDPKAYAWLAKQDTIFTVQNYGDDAAVKTGVVGKVFGMDVYMISVAEDYETVIVVNKDYIASGQFGDIAYVKIVDSTGTTYVIAKALLAFGKALSGGVVSFADNA